MSVREEKSPAESFSGHRLNSEFPAGAAVLNKVGADVACTLRRVECLPSGRNQGGTARQSRPFFRDGAFLYFTGIVPVKYKKPLRGGSHCGGKDDAACAARRRRRSPASGPSGD